MAYDPSGKGQIVELGTLADIRVEPVAGALDRRTLAPSASAQIDKALKKALKK
jgi:hypothetical protein